MVTKERHGIIMSTILFLLYIFVFLLTELTVNARSTVILGSDHVVTLYAIGLLCTSLGYAGFSLSRRLVNSENSRKLLMVMLAIAYMGCTFCFMYVRSSAIFTVSALASLLLFGYIGGFAHYTVALFLFGKGCTGRVIGTAVAAATVLQFLVQNLLATDTALVISLAMSVAGMIYLAVKPVKDWMFENPLPYASAPTITAKAFLVPMSIVAVMSLCFGLGDGLVTQLDASGAANLTSWARLLYAAGVFLAGVAADVSKRRFLPLCTLCSLLLFSSMALFLGEGASAASNLYICVMYLFSGFYVMYLTVMFLDAAPMAEDSALWAGMGRIVRGPFIALTAVLSTTLQDRIGQQGIAVADVCLSLVVLLMMLFAGQLNVRPEKANGISNRMAEFVKRYQLTPREAEIFSLLLDNDAANKDIAGELLLSVRVLERYISSIYEKVGVSSRIELMNVYYGKMTHGEAGTVDAASMAAEKPSVLRVSPIPAERFERVSLKYGLTRRETEILEQVCLRRTNEDIAAALGISENTVKFHVKNLMKKLSVSSRTEVREMLDAQ